MDCQRTIELIDTRSMPLIRMTRPDAIKEKMAPFYDLLKKINDFELSEKFRMRILRLITTIIDQEVFIAKLLETTEIAAVATTKQFAKDAKKENVEECEVASTEMNIKRLVEKLERNAFPTWLHEQNYAKSVKWSITLYFELTPVGRVLRERVDAHQPPISIEDASSALCLLYDSILERLQPKKKVATNDIKEWKEVFEKLSIHETTTQSIIRCLLLPIKMDSMTGFCKEPTWNDFLVHVNKLPINLQVDGLTETKAKLEQYLGTFSEKMEDVYFPLDSGKKFTNEVFIHLKNIKDGDEELKTLESTLLSVDPSEKLSFSSHRMCSVITADQRTNFLTVGQSLYLNANACFYPQGRSLLRPGPRSWCRRRRSISPSSDDSDDPQPCCPGSRPRRRRRHSISPSSDDSGPRPRCGLPISSSDARRRSRSISPSSSNDDSGPYD